MKIWARTSKIVGTTLLKSMAISGITWAQVCKHPKGIHFSMIPTEETTQELVLYQPPVTQIKRATGKNIEFFLPTSFASVVSDIRIYGFQ